MHVQGLFKDAPDLLSEFKDFLPEITGTGTIGGVGILPQPSSAAGTAGPSWGDNSVLSSIDRIEKTSKKPIPPLKRKKKIVEKDTTPVPVAKSSTNRVRCISSHLFFYYNL